MLKSRAAILASVLVMGALSMPVQAGIIYDNGGPNIVNGYSIAEPYSTADDFTLDSDTDVTGVGFYFQDFEGLAGWDEDFNYAIYADNGGLLGALLASGSARNVVATDSGLPWCCVGGNAYLVTFNLESAFAAVAGTTYWLELSNATTPSGYGYWITTDTNATNSGTNSGINNGAPVEQEFAFYLTDDQLTGSTVPEPGTVGIVGLALLALPVMRRFRKSASN